MGLFQCKLWTVFNVINDLFLTGRKLSSLAIFKFISCFWSIKKSAPKVLLSSTERKNSRSGSVYTKCSFRSKQFCRSKRFHVTVWFWSARTKPILDNLSLSLTGSKKKSCLFEDDILRSTYESSQNWLSRSRVFKVLICYVGGNGRGIQGSWADRGRSFHLPLVFINYYYQYTRPNKKLPSRKHAWVAGDSEFDGLQTHLRPCFWLVHGSSSDEY